MRSIDTRLSFRKIFLMLIILFSIMDGQAQNILHVGVAVAHDHVHGILNQYKKGEVIIIGIARR
jgi:hypothetical protein